MKRVSVIGATGYAGSELVKLLAAKSDVKISRLVSESHTGKVFSEVCGALRGVADIPLTPLDTDDIASNSDSVFLCLPHGTGMEQAAAFAERGVKIFDLSADFRMKDARLFETVYDIPHRKPELLPFSAYGLAEFYEEEIKRAKIVGVPGCYPTSVLVPILPLIKEKAVDTGYIIADCKSGISGAGKKPTEITHFCEVTVKAYAVFSHRHKFEIDDMICRYTGIPANVIFTPHYVPVKRGLLATIYTKSALSKDELAGIWKEFFKDKKHVRILNESPSMENVQNTPFIDIALFKKGDDLIIISAIDNLLKGAASQGVQCFDLCG
ncbi:MAG: N-acetyl-gamma-glutamyl-phosphate reductase [Deferribacteraceae bacterium]|jgi:N-acetyl-gamma-glutamyl-phosphate reductase|nr:N-acetyl-gamma-glutamyl-phosphate reductase [Deferribacteraceae bacterium]